MVTLGQPERVEDLRFGGIRVEDAPVMENADDVAPVTEDIVEVDDYLRPSSYLRHCGLLSP